MAFSNEEKRVLRDIRRKGKMLTALSVSVLVSLFLGACACQSLRMTANGEMEISIDFAYFCVIGLTLLFSAFHCLSARRLLRRTENAFMHVMRKKEEVVSVVLHDIRDPLATILAIADVERNKDEYLGEKDDAARERIAQMGKIVTCCERLGEKIAENIEITKNYTGQANARKESVDMSELVRSLVEEKVDFAKGKGVTVEAFVPEEEVDFFANCEKMNSLVANLVGNAIKYNRRGGRVEVSLSEEDDALLLEVSDTGIGMDEKVMERMYERYYQAIPDPGKGSGLGLAHVHSIVELYGGEIKCRSEVGVGTTFMVRLPENGGGA